MAGNLWAFDVDGTLLDSSGSLRAPIASALANLHDAQDHVVLATGRSVAAARQVLSLMPFVDWVVCANGAAILHRGQRPEHSVVHHHPLPVAGLVDRIMSHDGAARLAVEDLDGVCWINEHFEPGELMGPFSQADTAHLGTLDSFRMTVRPTDPSATFGLYDDVDLLARADIGRKSWFDVVAPGVTKATGLERVRRRLGIEARHTFAAGDESNDLEMVQWAGFSAAMGQRCPELGSAASMVAPSSDEDGVLEFLARARATR